MTSPNRAFSILAAYDGSQASQVAITAAVDLARRSSAGLAVVHVINPLSDLGDVSASSTDEAIEIKRRQREAEIGNLLSSGDIPTTVLVEALGRGEDVAARIGSVARARGATLVVVASRRASGLSGFILGSVAQELLKVSPIPVVVVRPD